MQGAPVTVHVTSPTRRLFSRIIRVVVMKPLMSSANAALADSRIPIATAMRRAHTLVARMRTSFLNGMMGEIAVRSYTPHVNVFVRDFTSGPALGFHQERPNA